MKMTVPVFAALVAAALPLGALAQAQPPQGGPPPAMRAQFQAAHEAARAAALNDLSPDHRAQVQTIVDGVNNGTTTDLRAAAQQIDAILSPQEAQAVLGEMQHLRDAMHAQMAQNASAGTPEKHRDAANGAGHQPDAGRMLLILGVSRERMHALRAAGAGAPKPQ